MDNTQLSRHEEQCAKLLAAQAEKVAKWLFKTFDFFRTRDEDWDLLPACAQEWYLTQAYSLLVCEIEIFNFRL